jgi:hypothetical protein
LKSKNLKSEGFQQNFWNAVTLFRVNGRFSISLIDEDHAQSVREELKKRVQGAAYFIEENSFHLDPNNTKPISSLDSKSFRSISARSVKSLVPLQVAFRNVPQEDNPLSPHIIYEPIKDKIKPKKIDIDALLYYPLSGPLSNVPVLLNEQISQQIDYIIDTAIAFPQYPQVSMYHFSVPGIEQVITLAYPMDPLVNDESYLVKLRQRYHELFELPMDRPLIRIVNAVSFSSSKSGDRLFNVHEGLSTPAGTSALVQGQYEYYHYMQDHFDDNGWGCAYRSLQTIESWFQHQNFTNKPVQSHQDIQKMLYGLGQRDKKFIGSREWIGSLEISAVLDKYLGIPSKILHVSKGSEISNHYRQLLDHFEVHGTPVMIGGGQLAYTLLGISYNESSDKVMFLILDPHYTGKDELPQIQKKGWCGWKDISLFKESYFYNLCLPQNPIAKKSLTSNSLQLI